MSSSSPEQKAEVTQQFARHEKDTGSPEVQIGILTKRILQLTEHLKIHKHDQHSRHGLLKLVGRRRRLLRYISRKNPETYRGLLKELGI